MQPWRKMQLLGMCQRQRSTGACGPPPAAYAVLPPARCPRRRRRLQAPKPSSGPHKTRECLPLILLLRNRLKYALTGKEVTSILMQRLVEVDGKVRTDKTYPVGFMDVVDIPKTGECSCRAGQQPGRGCCFWRLHAGRLTGQAGREWCMWACGCSLLDAALSCICMCLSMHGARQHAIVNRL